MDNNEDMFPEVPKGSRVKKILEILNQDTTELYEHPVYKEGFVDGQREAEERSKETIKYLTSLIR